MSENAGHISMETRERVITFVETADKLSFEYDTPLYTEDTEKGKDYMYFAFTNGLAYIFLFCTPLGYLAEIHDTDVEGATQVDFATVKNIRNYIFWLRKEEMVGLQSYYDKFKKDSGLTDEEINKKIEEYKDSLDDEEDE